MRTNEVAASVMGRNVSDTTRSGGWRRVALQSLLKCMPPCRGKFAQCKGLATWTRICLYLFCRWLDRRRGRGPLRGKFEGEHVCHNGLWSVFWQLRYSGEWRDDLHRLVRGIADVAQGGRYRGEAQRRYVRQVSNTRWGGHTLHRELNETG